MKDNPYSSPNSEAPQSTSEEPKPEKVGPWTNTIQFRIAVGVSIVVMFLSIFSGVFLLGVPSPDDPSEISEWNELIANASFGMFGFGLLAFLILGLLLGVNLLMHLIRYFSARSE